MHRDQGENAPRGTWNEDNASAGAEDPGRSVSGPYRDGLDTVRARRAALERELRDIDAMLAAKTRAGRELAAAEMQLRRVPAGSRIADAARWTVRGLIALAPLLWIIAFVSNTITIASPSVTRE